MLADLDQGTTSVLEHGYLNAVERAHGLPRAERQVRVTGQLGVIYRDAEYPSDVVVELDGGWCTTPCRNATPISNETSTPHSTGA